MAVRIFEYAVRGGVENSEIETSNKVLENLAKKYENVKEGVRSVMGGRYIELESTRFLEKAKQKA